MVVLFAWMLLQAQQANQIPDFGLSGNSGWAGAGLLGLVLGWLLLKHLPDKDKHIADLVEKHTQNVKDTTDKHETVIKAVMDKHEGVMTVLADQHATSLKEESERHDALIRDLTKAYKDELKEERRTATEHFVQLAGAVSKVNETVMAAFHTMADQIHSHARRNEQNAEVLRREAEKMQALKTERDNLAKRLEDAPTQSSPGI